MDLNTEFSGAEVLGLAGALLAVVAAFLPWVTAGVSAGPVEVSASATGIEGLGAITLLLAAVAVGVVLLLDWEARGSVATAVLGLAVLLVALWKILDLDGPASPGVGLYLTLLGGLGVTAAGAWGYAVGGTE